MPTVTLSTTAAIAVPGNQRRAGLLIINTDGTNTVYMNVYARRQTNPTSSDFDVKLGPGASISYSLLLDGPDVTSPFNCIAGAGSPVLSWGQTQVA